MLTDSLLPYLAGSVTPVFTGLVECEVFFSASKSGAARGYGVRDLRDLGPWVSLGS